jgi:hypothetical protein
MMSMFNPALALRGCVRNQELDNHHPSEMALNTRQTQAQFPYDALRFIDTMELNL